MNSQFVYFQPNLGYNLSIQDDCCEMKENERREEDRPRGCKVASVCIKLKTHSLKTFRTL